MSADSSQPVSGPHDVPGLLRTTHYTERDARRDRRRRRKRAGADQPTTGEEADRREADQTDPEQNDEEAGSGPTVDCLV